MSTNNILTQHNELNSIKVNRFYDSDDDKSLEDLYSDDNIEDKIDNALKEIDFDEYLHPWGNSNNLLKTNEPDDNETLKKLEEIDSDDDDLTPIEDIEPTQIKQHLELFKDQDFIALLRIYKNREELFNDFYKYINSSQIIKFTKLENEVDLSDNINFIKELNLNFQEEQIVDALKNTGNHLNLAIRCLLHNV